MRLVPGVVQTFSMAWISHLNAKRKKKTDYLSFLFGGETFRIGELFIDVSPPFLRVEIEWGVL